MAMSDTHLTIMRYCAVFCAFLINSTQHHYEIGTIIPILQTRNLKLRGQETCPRIYISRQVAELGAGPMLLTSLR